MALANDLRARCGPIPIVYAQLATRSTGFPYWSVVQEQQARVSLPRARMVQSYDLPLVDGLHLSWLGQLTLGQRMARAYAEVLEP